MSGYSTPEHNLVVSLAKGIAELPSTLYNTFTDPNYSTHSSYAKWEISLLRTFIKNLHYKNLQILSPNRSIKTTLIRHKKYGVNLNNYGETMKNFPGAIWLMEARNRTPNDPVLIFYHGGGYLFGFRSDSHLQFIINLAKELPSNYSILLVDYPLSPHPAPLNYNLQLWEELFNEQNLQNVITIGDSAGGHIILNSLASIISNDHNIEIKFPQRFKHVLISPWILLTKGHPHLSKNYDIIDPDRSDVWSKIFTQNSTSIDVSEFDYGGLLQGTTLVTAGELEMQCRAIEEFGKKYNVPVLVEKQGVHDQITMEGMLGYEEGDIFDKIVKFICE